MSQSTTSNASRKFINTFLIALSFLVLVFGIFFYTESFVSDKSESVAGATPLDIISSASVKEINKLSGDKNIQAKYENLAHEFHIAQINELIARKNEKSALANLNAARINQQAVDVRQTTPHLPQPVIQSHVRLGGISFDGEPKSLSDTVGKSGATTDTKATTKASKRTTRSIDLASIDSALKEEIRLLAPHVDDISTPSKRDSVEDEVQFNIAEGTTQVDRRLEPLEVASDDVTTNKHPLSTQLTDNIVTATSKNGSLGETIADIPDTTTSFDNTLASGGDGMDAITEYTDTLESSSIFESLKEESIGDVSLNETSAPFVESLTGDTTSLYGGIGNDDLTGLVSANETGQANDLPKRFYTIQLMGSRDISELKSFAKENNIGKVVYAKTNRNGRDWYTLIYGQYDTARVASNSISDLPRRVKKWSPFVKLIKQNQNIEILG